MTVQIMAGLVGLALTISVGGALDGFRDWLVEFKVRANPLRILGDALSSTMTVGFVVGATWAALSHANIPLTGGAVALAASVADELLALFHGVVRRVMPMRPMMPAPVTLMKPEKPKPGAPLSEDQAHAELDDQDERRLA